MPGDRSINVSGNVDRSGLSTGDHSCVSVSNVTTPEQDASLQAALTEIRKVLEALPGVNPRALTRLDEAAEEVDKSKPDRKEVVSLVKQATDYAKTANGFADQIAVLTPHLQQVASWVGQTWDQLSGTLGF